MKLPAGITYKTAEPERAASGDAARPVLEDPYLDAEAGRLVATDSYILVSLPVELDEGDVSGWVPAEALKAARKTRYANDDLRRIFLSENKAVVDTPAGSSAFIRINDRGEFPKWQQLVPPTEGREGEVLISLNAEKLLQAAMAIGTAEVTLRIIPQVGDDAR